MHTIFFILSLVFLKLLIVSVAFFLGHPVSWQELTSIKLPFWAHVHAHTITIEQYFEQYDTLVGIWPTKLEEIVCRFNSFGALAKPHAIIGWRC